MVPLFYCQKSLLTTKSKTTNFSENMTTSHNYHYVNHIIVFSRYNLYFMLFDVGGLRHFPHVDKWTFPQIW